MGEHASRNRRNPLEAVFKIAKPGVDYRLQLHPSARSEPITRTKQIKMASEILRLEGIAKSYGSNKVVDGVTLSVQQGEIFSLLGPSGCGKTTLLRICGGFEEPDAGSVILDGEDITHLPPNKREIRTVFQNYALFPNMRVRENIAFSLKVAKTDSAKVRSEVDRYLNFVQMSDHADKYPSQLSGGQKQRVAIARALINRPKVLLLDEPLAALDLKLRQRMLVELDQLHDEVGITFIFVTHDQGEAMSISDHIAVMNKGKVEQTGSPIEVYEAPKTSFVAAFIGDTNFFDGTVVSSEGDYSVLKIDGFPRIKVYNDKRIDVGDEVHLSIRPEKFSIAHEQPPEDPKRNVFQGKVEDIIYLGPQTKYWVRVQAWRVAVAKQHSGFAIDERKIKWKDDVWLSFGADSAYMLEKYAEDDENLLTLPDT